MSGPHAEALREAMLALRAALEREAKVVAGESPGPLPAPAEPPPESRLAQACAAFGLGPFERLVLVLALAPELNPALGATFAALNQDRSKPWPSVDLALRALPGARWAALSPEAPLRRWRLITLGEGEGFSARPLRVDEQVLHWLMGVDGLDPRLRCRLQALSPPPGLAPSQAAAVEDLRELRRAGAAHVQLTGADRGARLAVASAACDAVYRLPVELLPVAPAEREELATLWAREARLSGATLLLDLDEEDPSALRAALRFLEHSPTPILVARREPLPPSEAMVLRLEVPQPSFEERVGLWRGALEEPGDADLMALAAQFRLPLGELQAVVEQLGDAPPETALLWRLARGRVRPRLEELAQRIEVRARFEDLVLPEALTQTLRDLLAMVRQRATVHHRWGFAARANRGLGTSAMFAGPSGTGKTMAAEVLAGALHLDLYRIDLSQVVSKYIGETEKNLRRVFDAAEGGGALLLFDEADALFGKRTEVQDSHDRHANIEVSYLLQRLESYRGLAVLTTNQREALDEAFLRRINVIADFPFPNPALRAQIWAGMFPAEAPTQGLDPKRLAQLHISGGHIRSVALAAAFMAAEDGQPISKRHILRAARAEYAKIGRTLSPQELRGWK